MEREARTVRRGATSDTSDSLHLHVCHGEGVRSAELLYAEGGTACASR